MRIFYNNLIDAAGVVFTPTSEVTSLTAENLAHEFRRKPWRTGTSTALEAVVIDLLTAQAVTSVILLDHTLTASDTLIKIQGNATDSWGSPSFSQTLTYAAGTIAAVFASQTYRYWRLTFTKSASGERRDIGRLYLGTYYETTEQPDYDGYQAETEDNSRVQKTVGGQVYTENLLKFERLRYRFSAVPTAQADAIKTIIDAVGEAITIFVQTDTASPLDKVWYVKFRNATKRKVAAFDSEFRWDMDLEFEEAL